MLEYVDIVRVQNLKHVEIWEYQNLESTPWLLRSCTDSLSKLAAFSSRMPAESHQVRCQFFLANLPVSACPSPCAVHGHVNVAALGLRASRNCPNDEGIELYKRIGRWLQDGLCMFQWDQDTSLMLRISMHAHMYICTIMYVCVTFRTHVWLPQGSQLMNWGQRKGEGDES